MSQPAAAVRRRCPADRSFQLLCLHTVLCCQAIFQYIVKYLLTFLPVSPWTSSEHESAAINQLKSDPKQLSQSVSMSQPWDYIAKLVCIGDSGTGKSSVGIPGNSVLLSLSKALILANPYS